MSYVFSSSMPCFMLMVMMLFGLVFTVLNDTYIQRVHRRLILIIVALELVLIAQNAAEFLLDMHSFYVLRIYNSVIGYSTRPVIIVLFFHITSARKKHIAAWILAFVNMAVHVTAFFSDICFTVNENNHFQRGPLGYCCHIVSAILLAKLVYLSFCKRGGLRNMIDLIPVFNTLCIIVATFLDSGTGDQIPVTYLTVSIVCDSVFYYFWLHLRFAREHEEALMAEQRIQIMMTQIQPHFLYNTISTIKALCLMDPEQAADITGKFGLYLRQNLNSLTQSGMIPFSRELEHTKIYSDIEIVRFDYIRVEYDTDDCDFMIPPLTLQPIVENAIRHGVRGCEEGFVRVTSRRNGQYHEITVTDNGCGFDASSIEDMDSSHIGISNVRERLRVMFGGSLTVNSAQGSGTRVVIRIPAADLEKSDRGV